MLNFDERKKDAQAPYTLQDAQTCTFNFFELLKLFKYQSNEH